MKQIKGITLKRKVAQIIDRSYFVRFHMFIILMGTTLTGILASKILILLGVRSMAIRFGIAVIISYLMFFIFIKLWMLYVGAGNIFKPRRKKDSDSSSWIDIVPTPNGSSAGSGVTNQFTGFGGGSTGGGGVGGSYIVEGEQILGTAIGTGSDSGIGGGVGEVAGEAVGSVLGASDEGGLGLIAIIFLVVLVFSVVITGGYMIWYAPDILSEAVFQVLLVTGFSGKVRQVEETGWEISILKATWWAFLLVLIFSIGFGYAAQKSIPTAITIRDIYGHGR